MPTVPRVAPPPPRPAPPPRCFDTVKAFYKGLIAVGKDPKTSKVHVSSVACKLNGGEGMFDFFPVQYHPQNFCYLVVNPTKREATVLYHAWCGD